MPICLIHSLPGTRYALTDSLTVVMPNQSTECATAVPGACRKEIREGRAAWHTDSRLPQEGQAFSYEQLSAICSQWRNQGIFSFIEVRCSETIGDKERECLYRLKQAVDWLILDAESPMPALSSERWEHLAARMQHIGKRIGLRLRMDSRLSIAAQVPWVAKTALQLGAPRLLFIEGTSMEEGVEILRLVQDELSRHPLSHQSARCLPMLRPALYTIADRAYEEIDFSVLDAVLIESGRPFFGGVAVYQEHAERLFGISLWQALVTMLSQKSSSASFIEREVLAGSPIPPECRRLLIRAICELAVSISKREPMRVSYKKKEIEGIWSSCLAHMVFCQHEHIAALQAIVSALIEQSDELIAKREKPRLQLFGSRC